jgi:predicted nuclease of predicted toxin-antitoxin system
MKFFIDMPLPPQLVDWLTQRGHEARHASQVGMHQAEDSGIIAWAREHNCIILTADLHFPRLLALTRAHSPGLILFRGGDFSDREVAERLEDVLRSVPEATLRASIVTVDHTRVRRRPLPID